MGAPPQSWNRESLRASEPTLPSLNFALGAMTDGDKKDGALTLGVRREKARDVVIEKGEAGGAEPLCVGCEVQLASEDAGFELHRTIAAIAEALQNGAQVGEE